MELGNEDMTNNQQITQGSEWGKWDLHVHSPASHGFKGSCEQFETQLQNADCDVIGINDYFSVAGYKQIKDKIDAGDLDIGDKKILPVAEFRMTESIQNKHTKTNGVAHFNFHIIFSDTIEVADIETLIKSQRSDGTRIGNDYDDKEKLRNKKIPLFKLLEELNQDKKFKDQFLLLIPYDEYGGIDEIDPQSDGWIKDSFIKTAHILGSSRQKQIDFFLWKSKRPTGQPKFTQDQFREWFLRKKPCIKGSDSHSHDWPIGKLKNEESKPTNKYCWIKATPTFEGLKQIIYEPETRVYIGEEKPKKPINTIDSIDLRIPSDATVGEGDSFCFAGSGTSFALSPYFNCFIGGRGSGKSTILNFLGQHSSNPESSIKFWDELNPSFRRDDANIFSFNGAEVFEFLAQSEIESFVKDKTRFTQAIYGRANSRAGNTLDDFENEIALLQGNLDEIIRAVADLKDYEKQREIKEKEKSTLENSVRVQKSEAYIALDRSIRSKTKERQRLNKWKQSVTNLKSDLERLLALLPAETATEKKDDNQTSSYEEAFGRALDKIRDAIHLLDEQQFAKEIKIEKSIIDELADLKIKVSTLFKEIGYTPENIEQMQSAPQKITDLEEEIKRLDRQIKATKETTSRLGNISEKLTSQKQGYEEKIAEVLKPLQDVLSKQLEDNEGKDIKQISLAYDFNEKEAWISLADELYNTFKGAYGTTEHSKKVCDFINENKEVFKTDSFEEVKQFMQDNKGESKRYINFLDEVFKDENNFKTFQAIRNKHLYDVKANKVIQVKYDGKDIEKSSFGQRCTAVIVILILFGNHPLIIDEPEAHLDSALIANYLVPLIKEKKSDRQIIFATHNANFVINGDAEKIFILKNESGQTEVIETTIEDTENRQELLKLEGGKEAFEKRGEKFSIR